jgi:hypothetical protein
MVKRRDVTFSKRDKYLGDESDPKSGFFIDIKINKLRSALKVNY